MFWARVNRCKLTLLIVGVMLTASSGCARPRGVVFEVLDSPRVWPSPPDAARIALVGSIRGSQDLKAGRSAKEGFLAALRGPRPPIRFTTLQDVAVRGRNWLAVADGSLGAVHLIDLNERTHTTVSGWSDGRFEAPVGVEWVGRRLFVTDGWRGEVIELDERGSFRNRFGSGILARPVDIVYVRSRDQLYVVDGGDHQIVVFDMGGKLVRKFGGPGSAPGLLNYPTYIAYSDDRVVVADSGNFRVQVLDLDGRCLSVIGQKGNAAGDFALPKGVAIDSVGHVYVVDAHFENVQIFNREGQLLMAFGSEGRVLGGFWLPAGIAIDQEDRIWVADSGNRRLQVFDYLRHPL